MRGKQGITVRITEVLCTENAPPDLALPHEISRSTEGEEHQEEVWDGHELATYRVVRLEHHEFGVCYALQNVCWNKNRRYAEGCHPQQLVHSVIDRMTRPRRSGHGFPHAGLGCDPQRNGKRRVWKFLDGGARHDHGSVTVFQINASEKPFWMLKKDVFTSEKIKLKRGRKPRRKTPWHNTCTQEECTNEFTTYLYNEYIYYDAKLILRQLINTQTTGVIYITPGHRDCTDWRAMRMFYGCSSIKEITTSGTSNHLLKDWAVKHNYFLTIRVTPHRTRYVRPSYLKNIHKYIKHLANADEEEINFLWRIRNEKFLNTDFDKRELIWKECQKRYPGLIRTKLNFKLTYFDGLNVEKIKGHIVQLLMDTPWPECIKNWHRSHISFSVAEPKPIQDILVNVNKPWRPTKCNCQNILHDIRKKQPSCQPCMIDDHIFILGREYDGPMREAFNTPANNIPLQTAWDARKSYDQIWEQIPEYFRNAQKEWGANFKHCCIDFPKRKPFVQTKHIYTLRKLFKGLVIGQTDKNLNELWAICPQLYEQAWRKLYGTQAGYQQIFPKKFTKTTQDCESIYTTDIPARRFRGDHKDIIKHWARLYKKRGWDKFATFDNKGNFNTPYAIFKAKNIVDPDVRKDKWHKGRPIAPQTKHPMRRLFHITGRALSFITSCTTKDEFTLHTSQQVPQFLQQTQSELGPLGTLKMNVKDIEGCFVHMPKEAIQLGLREKIQELKNQGLTGVIVPRKNSLRCSFSTAKKYGYKKIPFDILYEVMEFALHNTLVKDLHGNLLHQSLGIPMGDPHSPGMAIGACAWMEKLWMETLHEDTKKYFRAKRYMDDILIIRATNQYFDDNRFLHDFQRSDCYWPPLKLEDGQDGIFLETEIQIQNNQIRHKLKNNNAQGFNVWRYADIRSNNRHLYKKATLINSLQKVNYMASDDNMLIGSAIDKLKEFMFLGYPRGMLYDMCTRMAVTTRSVAWFMIRGKIMQWYQY